MVDVYDYKWQRLMAVLANVIGQTLTATTDTPS